MIGSEEKIKALKFINRELKLMERKHAVYIITLFNEYGQKLNALLKIGDIHHRNYFLRLVYDDHISKCNELQPKYTETFVSHMKNVIYAKYKTSINQ